MTFDAQKMNTDHITSLAIVLDAEKGKQRLYECKDNTSSTGYALVVEIATTFSGIVTNNLNMYRPDRMRDSAWQFGAKYSIVDGIEGVGLPLLWSHDDSQVPIGRFIRSRYIDTSKEYLGLHKNLSNFVANSEKMDSADILKVARAIGKYQLKSGSKFHGLGYVKALAQITDPEHIRRVQDKRYFNVSTEQRTNMAACCICGSIKINGVPTCDHELGDIVDGTPVFSVWDRMVFGEGSFVNRPAQPFARILNNRVVTGNIDESDILSLALDYEVPGNAIYVVSKPATDLMLVYGSSDSESQANIVSFLTESNIMIYKIKQEYLEKVRNLLGSSASDILDATGTISSIDGLKSALGDKFNEEYVTEVVDEETTSDGESIDEPSDSSAASDTDNATEDIVTEDKEETVVTDNQEEPKPVVDYQDVYNKIVEKIKELLAENGITDSTQNWINAITSEGDSELEAWKLATGDESMDAKSIKRAKASVFLGPGNTFPVPDKEHAIATLAIIEDIDISDQLKNAIISKAKLLGVEFDTEEVTDEVVENKESDEFILTNINDMIELLAGKMSEEDQNIYLEGYEPVTDAVGSKSDKNKKGGSNAGKYSKKDGPFCGPSGGAPKGTYPVGSLARAKSALKLAHNAPNPSGVKSCVYKHWPQLKPDTKSKDTEQVVSTVDTTLSDSLVDILEKWRNASEKDILALAKYLDDQLQRTDINIKILDEVWDMMRFIRSKKIESEREKLLQKMYKLENIIQARDSEIIELKGMLTQAEIDMSDSVDKNRTLLHDMINTAVRLGIVDNLETDNMSLAELEGVMTTIKDSLKTLDEENGKTILPDGSVGAGASDEEIGRFKREVKGKLLHGVIKDLLTFG